MITKDTVQNYSKHYIFNQLEIEREKVKELMDQLKSADNHFSTACDDNYKLEQEIEKLKVTTINEIINKVESMKGLAGRMAMGEWSSAMIEMLEGLKEEK